MLPTDHTEAKILGLTNCVAETLKLKGPDVKLNTQSLS
jgi:hypothetical protein